MIEETILENERRGDFIRVYPNVAHVHEYRKFFEEERQSDNILYHYIYSQANFETFYRNLLK